MYVFQNFDSSYWEDKMLALKPIKYKLNVAWLRSDRMGLHDYIRHRPDIGASQDIEAGMFVTLHDKWPKVLSPKLISVLKVLKQFKLPFQTSGLVWELWASHWSIPQKTIGFLGPKPPDPLSAGTGCITSSKTWIAAIAWEPQGGWEEGALEQQVVFTFSSWIWLESIF